MSNNLTNQAKNDNSTCFLQSELTSVENDLKKAIERNIKLETLLSLGPGDPALPVVSQIRSSLTETLLTKRKVGSSDFKRVVSLHEQELQTAYEETTLLRSRLAEERLQWSRKQFQMQQEIQSLRSQVSEKTTEMESLLAQNEPIESKAETGLPHSKVMSLQIRLGQYEKELLHFPAIRIENPNQENSSEEHSYISVVLSQVSEESIFWIVDSVSAWSFSLSEVDSVCPEPSSKENIRLILKNNRALVFKAVSGIRDEYIEALLQLVQRSRLKVTRKVKPRFFSCA